MEQKNELRQIMNIVFEGKWIIVVSIVLALISSAVLSWFILEEQYESRAVIQVESSVQDTGIMSNYIAAEFTPMVYMHRISNEKILNDAFQAAGYRGFVKNNLTVTNTQNTALVELTYKGHDPEETQKQLQLALEETKNQMNISVKNTLNQLEKTYLDESESLSKEIEELMNKYNGIVTSNKLPEILILQTISDSNFVINLSEEQTEALTGISASLQNELLQLNVEMGTKSSEYQNVLAKFQSVKTGLDSFRPDPFIRIIVEPTIAEFPSSPVKGLNLVIGLLLGSIIGFTLVLFRYYWKSTAPKGN